MDASGTSNSSVVSADGGSSNAGDEDSCSTRVGDAFAFDFGILRVGSGRKEGENRAEFVTRQLFPVDGGSGGELTQEQSSRPNWVDLTFGQAGSFGGGLQDLRVLLPPPPQQQQVKKSRRGPRSRSSQYRGVTFYRRTEHVEDLKTIREFRNVFDAEVQKLEAYGFQLGTEITTTGDNSWPMPVNLKSLIWNAQKTFKVVTGDDAMSMEAQKNATLFFSILLRSTFASKRVLNEYRLTREPFDWIIVR
ncbi:hypothetical protein RJ639_042350 [Escallonia herrerae]|uniref:RNA polymerase Rpb1 domain-containing protein n=1 Tax=Escallonia herrerae TaxID=1293975 RepID=A0AA88WGT5_9ASTE|nr:hypothetical protein RJ639_042350 [Escallonia herrerae]